MSGKAWVVSAVVAWLSGLAAPVDALDLPFTPLPIEVDGDLTDPAWAGATSFSIPGAGNNGPLTVQLLWDQANFYLGYTAVDTDLWDDGAADGDQTQVWQDDSVDFNMDLHHDKGAAWGPDDVELDIDLGGQIRTLGGSQWWAPENIVRQSLLLGTLNNSSDVDVGYTMEVQVPWSELINPYSGRRLGVTFGNSDDDLGGDRDAYHGTPGTHPFVPDTYLDLTLTGGPETPVPMYSNSVLKIKNYNLPDPAVVFHEGRYYTVLTPHESGHNKILMYSSPNLADWDFEGIVYETPGTPGSWNEGWIWGPDLFVDDGQFYMTYAARPANSPESAHRTGIVSSPSMTGPYTDLINGPLIDFGELAIDGDVKEFNGKHYIYWSQYANQRGILGAEVSDDFKTLATSPVTLFSDGPDEDLVEAPWTYERDGVIYLFYSANAFNDEDYRVGYATSTSPLGPFTKRGHILVKNTEVKGPGHNAVVDSPDGKETFIVYHTWPSDFQEGDRLERKLAIDRLFFRDDGSVFAFGPTTDDHPLPSGVDGSFGVLPIGNPGFETGDLSDWTRSSSTGSTSHLFVETNSDPNQTQEGQHHATIWNWGASKDGRLSQVLGGLEEGATYRVTAWTRNDGRTLTFGVTPDGGTEVSLVADHLDFAKEELDFLVPAGFNAATLWFDSPAGGNGSWAWIDAVEVFKILSAPVPGDFDGDGDVDAADLAQWQGDFGTNGDSDADGDGDSDGDDFLVWQRHVSGSQSGETANFVPEPPAWGLVMLGVSQMAVALSGRRGFVAG